MSDRIVFARVGWMKYYQGPRAGDERPIGGGSYNEKHVGHEAHNLTAIDGWYYGYAQPASTDGSIRLDRIDPSVGAASTLDNTTVVFFAKNPAGGQVVVGWYKDATVFREQQSVALGPTEKRWYFCKTTGAYLIPVAHRRHVIPQGKGATGQSNITYPFDQDGRRLGWVDRVLEYTRSYEGPDLIRDDLAEASDQMQAALEVAAAVRAGQRFGGTPEERKAIEDRAMRAAEAFYKAEGYACDSSVHKTKPYDLLCKKDQDVRYVEVKGTRGGPESVFLTRREVRHVCEHDGQCDLFVLHGIRMTGRGSSLKAEGGTRRLLRPWVLDRTLLEPLAFEYRLPAER